MRLHLLLRLAKYWKVFLLFIVISGALYYQVVQFLRLAGLLADKVGVNDTRQWRDETAIKKDALRTGLGEQGKAAPSRWTYTFAQSQDKGINTKLSDVIALTRALPDVTNADCRQQKFPYILPEVTIIIVGGKNDHESVLMRTVGTILARTPDELILEIIIVNDCSDFDYVVFWEYLNAVYKLKVLHTKKCMGIAWGRIFGAAEATAEILVFVDAQVEVTHNWLPPLLAPIYNNPETCTSPVIDTIRYDTFEYVPTSKLTRVGYNWQLEYIELPLSKVQGENISEPYETFVIDGRVFAIDSIYFWSMGAYDESLRDLDAAQLELTFKCGICGHRILKVPCSRVAYLKRDPAYTELQLHRQDDLRNQNYKRLAEVWLDEYKHIFYAHMPKLKQTPPGDLKFAKKLRDSLKCNQFKWYLHNRVPDLLAFYPPEYPLEPENYANGTLQSLAMPTFCLDALNKSQRSALPALQTCSEDLKQPTATQMWHLNFRRNLVQNNNCLHVKGLQKNASVWVWPCHNESVNQFWYYNRQTKMLEHRGRLSQIRCLEVDTSTRQVQMNPCDKNRLSMKWNFGFFYPTAIIEYLNLY